LTVKFLSCNIDLHKLFQKPSKNIGQELNEFSLRKEKILLKLDSLTLPNNLPTDKAIKSCGQNIHNYEPEFWEFQYEIYRYLKNITESRLIERYKNICRNFEVLTSCERDVIPIDSFLSSWYWFRKEHQTRFEFYLRDIKPPITKPHPRPFLQAPVRSEGPNSCDVLFRYGNLDFMKLFVERGEVRISPASSYEDGIANDPRNDDELNKKKWLFGDRTTIKIKEGKQTPIIGALKEIVSTQTDYYTLCMSCDYEPRIFEEFGYDSCIFIRDPVEFAKRIEQNSKIVLPEFYFYHNPIEYFDPHEPIKNQYFEPTMCKDFVYAYQMEYRFLWFPFGNGAVSDHITLILGPIDDICELYILK
jgi:hypothetical protein